ncbi:protein Mis18-beta isoform X2 [Dunckerocampus dactyliophorus]|uniref:protein Mis18-beta isoform X2 n=1 Tax=Dunckerocampus dactyliophorus TaxID=161453 RepID=UPI002405BD07|nr:protein Mis18-beta isoform X2 [Dunckerocampus dactyliophorus]
MKPKLVSLIINRHIPRLYSSLLVWPTDIHFRFPSRTPCTDDMEFNESVLAERTGQDKTVGEKERRRWTSFHCKHCNTVLGDSLAVCGEFPCLDAILSLRVTSDVLLSSDMECGHKGDMAHCIFSSVRCGECGVTVGKVIHAAPPRLAMLRSLFLLHKASIRCYTLGSSSMVRASSISFDLMPLGDELSKLRKQFEADFDHVTQIKSCLEDNANVSRR